MSDGLIGSAPEPILIGVTGNIGCGKSTVTSELARLGATIIDADLVYHDLIQPGTLLWSRILERFGKSIALPDGRIDRRALGSIVFSDPKALIQLESLTHPAIRAEVLRRVHDATTPVVAVSAVKLIEGGWKEICDVIWLVTCTEENQRSRLSESRQLSSADVDARLSAQPRIEAKLKLADVIIDNSGTLEETHAQIHRAWKALCEELGERPAHAGKAEKHG
ncbi:MAG: dephospho-CoA kinase [Thermomicrobiales bacterium]